jgi:hypothetical protein
MSKAPSQAQLRELLTNWADLPIPRKDRDLLLQTRALLASPTATIADLHCALSRWEHQDLVRMGDPLRAQTRAALKAIRPKAIIVSTHVVIVLPSILNHLEDEERLSTACDFVRNPLAKAPSIVNVDPQDALEYDPELDYSIVFPDRMRPL